MGRVNIVLLILAGAVGGALVMKVTQRPHPVQLAEAPEPSAPPSVPTAAEAVPASVPAIEPPQVTGDNSSPKPALQAPVTQTVEPVATDQVEAPKPEPSKPAPSKTEVTRQPAVRHPAILLPKRMVFQQPAERHSIPAPAPTVVAQVQTPPPAAAPTPPLTPEQPKETPPGNMEPEEVTPLPAPIPAPPEPAHTVTLNAGTLIPVRLVDSLSLERNQVGDRFAATLYRELDADGFVLAERGARVEGRVAIADRGAKTLGIELTSVATSDRQYVAIQTERFDKHIEVDRAQDATKVGAGAVIGAVIGGMAGGGKGAAIGAGVGGGAGAGDVMLTRKPVTIPSETTITFRLRAPVTITERRD
jgi:hypothetical protein